MCEVGAQTVQSAAAIVKHLNQQKIILAGKDVHPDGGSTSRVPQGDRIRRLLSNVHVPTDCCINPSTVGQKHISERVGTSYPVSKANELLETAADLGFGEFVVVHTPSNRNIRKFKKRRLEELPEHSLATLKKLRISEEAYKSTFAASPLTPVDINIL